MTPVASHFFRRNAIGSSGALNPSATASSEHRQQLRVLTAVSLLPSTRPPCVSATVEASKRPLRRYDHVPALAVRQAISKRCVCLPSDRAGPGGPRARTTRQSAVLLPAASRASDVPRAASTTGAANVAGGREGEAWVSWRTASCLFC